MHRSIFRIYISLAIALSLGAAALLSPPPSISAAAGISRYVSPSGNDTTNCASAGSPCKTIAYALNQSNSGDTLLLDAGVYAEHLTIDRGIRIVQNPEKRCNYFKVISINPPVLVWVPCATLDGTSSGRVIDVITGTEQVSLEKLTIRNGQVTDDSGAGIRSIGQLIIDDVTLRDNHVVVSDPNDPDIYTYRGGAIDNQGQLTLRSSSVHDNSAYNGGGISSTGSLLLVQNTEIDANSAASYGGGIAVPYGELSTLENTTLYGNNAVMGGGMYIGTDSVADYMGKAHVFRNVTISGNSASSYGGLFSMLQVTIDHSTLASNSASVYGSDLYLTENQVNVGHGYAHSSVANTIVSHPSATVLICHIDGAASFDLSGGGNLSSDASCDFNQAGDQQNKDPLLLPLAENGGYVQTRALPFGSPAIDHAGPYALGADARGVFPQDGDLNGSVVPDVGAYEYVPNHIYIPAVRK